MRRLVLAAAALRGDLGFSGVVVSDDLLGKALAGTPVTTRGARFLAAGGDLGSQGLVACSGR